MLIYKAFGSVLMVFTHIRNLIDWEIHSKRDVSKGVLKIILLFILALAAKLIILLIAYLIHLSFDRSFVVFLVLSGIFFAAFLSIVGRQIYNLHYYHKHGLHHPKIIIPLGLFREKPVLSVVNELILGVIGYLGIFFIYFGAYQYHSYGIFWLIWIPKALIFGILLIEFLLYSEYELRKGKHVIKKLKRIKADLKKQY